jgi:hypothetical protein
VTDNQGVTATVSATITQPEALGITISSSTDVGCNGSLGSATANEATGGASPYTYSWSPIGGTAQTATGLGEGTYTITVNDNNGCTASAAVTISQSSAISARAIVTYNVYCNGESDGLAKAAASGDSSPYTYSWSPNNSTTYIAGGLSAGTYTVTVTGRNGCSDTAVVTITQPEILVDSVVSVTYPSCIVPTGSATIGVTGGTSPYFYIWSPNVSTTATATGLSPRSYVVVVKDAHGCTHAITFSISQPPALRDSAVQVSTINELCNGEDIGTATIGVKYGTSPYTYSWNPNVNSTASASGLSAGTYTVTASDTNSCSATTLVIITQPADLHVDTATVNETTIPCNGQAIISVTGGTEPYTYSWSGGQTTSKITGQCHGTYCCVISDSHGCSETVCVTILNPLGVGIENIRNSSSIDIYPNPNTGQFTVAGVEKGMIIELYNYIGQKISSISATDETMHINISNEANGVYLIRIMTKDGVLVTDKKMVKIE